MSHQALSADTEVVLLLCGRFGGERQEPFQPLSARDYGELAKWLNARSLRPSDLMSAMGSEHFQSLHEAKLERKRIEFLMGRGTAMALALERWSRGGLWVISRGDPEFPKRLKRQLKHTAPPLLYGAGQKELLDIGGLAIIGSRDATETALDFTRDIAAKCAKEGMGVVSGGARGVDAAAMQGATDAGGYTIGVLANDLLKTCVNRQNRLGLQEGRLVLVSPFYPEAGFSPGNAMARNKYIYTLAERALVIDSALGSGGTWEGALENLSQKWVPLYVRTPGSGPGNAALVEKGGTAFTFRVGDSETLVEFFERTAPATTNATETSPPQQSLLSAADATESTGPIVGHVPIREEEDSSSERQQPEPPKAEAAFAQPVQEPESEPCTSSKELSGSESILTLDMFEDFALKLKKVLSQGPLAEEEIAERLGLEKGQAKVWLKKAADSGSVEKQKKPVRYSLGLQSSLLD